MDLDHRDGAGGGDLVREQQLRGRGLLAGAADDGQELFGFHDLADAHGERDGGDEEGSDQHGADKDDEELEEEGQGRTQREVGTREEERHGLHPAGLAASGGKDQGRGGPEKPDEPEKEQQEKTQP